MKRFKKVLCFVLPVVMVVALVLGIVLPVSHAAPAENKQKHEVNEQSTYGGQVTYAADDTGAHTAAKEYKGGAIFLEPNSNMTMSGGSITGHSNTYGGAIYISNGATFTMTGGTISGNTASYGGAIYVESGGKCIIEAGAIKGNKANHGAAVYVEQGGEFSAGAAAEIAENEIEDENFSLKVSEDTIYFGEWLMSAMTDVKAHYLFLGSFPQSHVSKEREPDLYNDLESEAELRPDGDDVLNMYDKTDTKEWLIYNCYGETYVRGECAPYESGYSYMGPNIKQLADPNPRDAGSGGDVVEGTEWYKVEPIRWLVLNYDEWMAGEEEIEIISEEILAAMPFSLSENSAIWCEDVSFFDAYEDEGYGTGYFDDYAYIRRWLNNYFAPRWLSSDMRYVNATLNPNSMDRFHAWEYKAGDDGMIYEYDLDPSQWTGNSSLDYVYLLSYYDVVSKYCVSHFAPDYKAYQNTYFMQASPSDFAIANGIPVDLEARGILLYAAVPMSRYRFGTSAWWLRTSVSAPFNYTTGLGMTNCCVTSNSEPVNISVELWDMEKYDGYSEQMPYTILGVRPSMHLNLKP